MYFDCFVELRLPGPQKHVKEWPKATINSQKAISLHSLGVQVSSKTIVGGAPAMLSCEPLGFVQDASGGTVFQWVLGRTSRTANKGIES